MPSTLPAWRVCAFKFSCQSRPHIAAPCGIDPSWLNALTTTQPGYWWCRQALEIHGLGPPRIRRLAMPLAGLGWLMSVYSTKISSTF